MFIRKRCTLTATLIYSLMIIALVSCGGGNGGAGPAKETSINQWVWMTGSKVVNQAIATPDTMTYGQSVTDACLNWDETVPVLDALADAIRQRRSR